jgi:hypothetical protein
LHLSSQGPKLGHQSPKPLLSLPIMVQMVVVPEPIMLVLKATCGEWAIASHGRLLVPLVFFFTHWRVCYHTITYYYYYYFSKNYNNFIQFCKFYYVLRSHELWWYFTYVLFYLKIFCENNSPSSYNILLV